mgnify:FL=1
MGVRKGMAQIFSAIMDSLVSAVEQRTIAQMLDKHPGRYIHIM